MDKKLLEILGWYGTIAIISAYGLLSLGLVNSSNLAYQLLNLTGAVGIVGVSLYKKTYQPAVLNVIWIIIALLAITKIIFI